MNIRSITLVILALLTISTAHAESYTFTDNTSFTPDDYVRCKGYNLPPAKVTTRVQNISETTGVISDLNVTLHGIYTSSLSDMTFVLVGPNKTGVVLASHAGGRYSRSGVALNNTTLTFDDEAATYIRTPIDGYTAVRLKINSGSYMPTANLSPANWIIHEDKHNLHEAPYHSTIARTNPVKAGIFTGVNFSDTNKLSAFNSISANGSWNLLAYDNISDTWYRQHPNKLIGHPSITTIAGGWSLNITTSPASGAVPEPAEWMLIGLCACGIVILKFKPQVSGLKIYK